MQTKLLIEDGDRNVDYLLLVDYDLIPAEPEVGVCGGIEINGVACSWLTTICGADRIVASMTDACRRTVGEWCAAKYADDIHGRLREVVEQDAAAKREERAEARQLRRNAAV